MVSTDQKRLIIARLVAGLEFFLQNRSPIEINEASGDSLSFSSHQIQSYLDYFEFLENWNRKVDLVSPAPFEHLISRHLIDSIAAWRLLRLNLVCTSNLPLIDIGSGAGLPGIIIAIQDPEQAIILCEPRFKRGMFLREIKKQLKLENVTIFQGKIEELALKSIINTEIVITRALKINAQMLQATAKLLVDGGYFVKMAGAEHSEPELSYCEKNRELRFSKKIPYSIPGDTEGRTLLVWKCFT